MVLTDSLHTYVFKYEKEWRDWKSQTSGVDKFSKTIHAESLNEAVKYLPDDIDIICVYKDNKMLHSFRSKHVGESHRRGSKEKLKEVKE